MAETTLYQLASQGPQQMMSYILRTKSGKLAVIWTRTIFWSSSVRFHRVNQWWRPGF